MSVRIHLHRTHRSLAGGAEHVDVEGQTVGGCLEQLVAMHPALGGALFDQPGMLRRNVEIWLNLESAYPGELERPTKDGDQVHVTILLSGG